MKAKLVLAAVISIVFSANAAFAQFHWENLINAQGSITTKVEGLITTVTVTGSSASDRVEVERIGSSAMVKLYNNERLIRQKLVRPVGLPGILPANESFGNSSTGGGGFTRPEYQFRNGKELWLECKLGEGNDHFSCDSNIFDQIAVYGGGGDDILISGPSISYMFGGKGDDIILGGSSAELLMGEKGNDWIVGGDGDDFIVGGPGSDILSSIGNVGTDGSDEVFTGTVVYNSDDEDFDMFWVDSTDNIRIGVTDNGTITTIP